MSSVTTDYSGAFSPPPPVQVSVLGQIYGKHTATGILNCALQAGARWQRADGTGGATIPKPESGQTCCFCCHDQAVTRARSARKRCRSL